VEIHAKGDAKRAARQQAAQGPSEAVGGAAETARGVRLPVAPRLGAGDDGETAAAAPRTGSDKQARPRDPGRERAAAGVGGDGQRRDALPGEGGNLDLPPPRQIGFRSAPQEKATPLGIPTTQGAWWGVVVGVWLANNRFFVDGIGRR
jgi:hypothetical protein